MPLARPLRPTTDPARLEAAARLAGLHPPPATRFTCLELDAGRGEDLLALAARYPDARFVGVTFDGEGARDDARRTAAALALENVSFHAAEGPPGPYDYVIASDLLSSVRLGPARALLTALRGLLAPNGVALVGYDTAFGASRDAPLRALLAEHVRGRAPLSPSDARDFVRWLADAARDHAPAQARALDVTAARLPEDTRLLRERRGFTATELRALLDDCGLAAHGDVLRSRDAEHTVPEEFTTAWAAQDSGANLTDLADLVAARDWREALVTRDDVAPRPDPPTITLRNLYFRHRPSLDHVALPLGPETWRPLWDALASATHDVSLPELCATVSAAERSRLTCADAEVALLAWLDHGALEVLTRPARLPRADGPPRLWRVAEAELRAGAHALSSRLHRTVPLTAAQRALARLIADADGDLDAAVRDAASAGRLPLPVALAPGALDPDARAAALEAALPTAVEWGLQALARLGLLD